MADELPQISVGEFETVSQLVSSSDSLQMALLALGIGIITTLYSAYFLARHLTSMIVLKKKEGEINL